MMMDPRDVASTSEVVWKGPGAQGLESGSERRLAAGPMLPIIRANAPRRAAKPAHDEISGIQAQTDPIDEP